MEAIAVNADMDYVFVRLNSSKPDEVFLAAQERIEELKPILGDVEVLGHIKGERHSSGISVGLS